MSSPFVAGQNSDVVLLGSTVVRRARHEAARDALRLEARLLPLLRPSLPVPIPDPSVMEIGSDTLSCHAMIAGTSITQLDTWPPERMRDLAASLANVLAALREYPTQALRADASLRIPVMDVVWWEHLCARLARTVLPELPAAARERAVLMLRRHVQRVPSLELRLIHGDFGSENLLASEYRLTGVIDFGSACIGDPLWDLAGLSASFGEDFAARVAASHSVLQWDADRARFYRFIFALEEALHGIENGDATARAAGLENAHRLAMQPSFVLADRHAGERRAPSVSGRAALEQ